MKSQERNPYNLVPGKKFVFSRKYELVVKNREIVKSVTIVVPVDSIGDDDMGSGTKDMQASAVAKAASFGQITLVRFITVSEPPA